MSQLQTKQQVNRLAWLFAITYMVSYITRINYGAIVSEMESAMQISKSQISMALTGSFIMYGIGQIISGIFGDRFSPKKLVFFGLLITSCMNLLLPVCQTPYQMLGVWCVNGLAQAFLWPPLVRLMTTLLSQKDYNKVTVKVACGSSAGTIIVYLLSPLLIYLFNWKAVFLFSAICGVVMAFVWNRFSYDVEPVSREPERADFVKEQKSALLCPFMIGIMAAIVFQGMLRDGATTWMPSYVAETYHIGNEISILTGVAIPIFGILCLKITSGLYARVFKNPILCAGVLFGVGTLSTLGLCLFTGHSAAISVAMSAVFIGCMHGVNLMLISIVPSFFKRHGNVATVSGILNFCTYIGSAASTYGIAVLSEQFGWNTTILIWLLIAAVGTAVCFVCVKPWRKSFKDLSEK